MSSPTASYWKQDGDEAHSFWKHVKQVRDDESITKEELPDRLKDAAADNPQLFVQLVDEMINLYETKTRRKEGTKSSHQSRTRKPHRQDYYSWDDMSHSRSVISYDPSVEEIEVFCGEDEIKFHEDGLTVPYSLSGLEERHKSWNDLPGTTVAFELQVDAVEVQCELDDNASQVSNLSYASQVADMIRNLRQTMAGNNSLASEVAKEMDELSQSKEKYRKQSDKQSHSKKKYREPSDKQNNKAAAAVAMSKSRSRSSTGTLRGLHLVSSDQRDDVSLLSDNDFSHSQAAVSAENRKTKRGMFSRFFKTKKRNLHKPRRPKAEKQQSKEELQQSTINSTTEEEKLKRDNMVADQIPRHETYAGDTVDESFDTNPVEERKDENIEEPKEKLSPLRIHISPCVASHTSTFEGNQFESINDYLGHMNTETTTGDVSEVLRSTKEDTTKKDWETEIHVAILPELDQVPSDEVEEEEENICRVTVDELNEKSERLTSSNGEKLNVVGRGRSHFDRFDHVLDSFDHESLFSGIDDAECKVLKDNTTRDNQKAETRGRAHSPPETFFAELGTKNVDDDLRSKGAQKPPSKSPQKKKWVHRSPMSLRRKSRNPRKSPRKLATTPSQNSSGSLVSKSPQKTGTPASIETSSPKRGPVSDVEVGGTISDGSDNLFSLIGTFDESLGGKGSKNMKSRKSKKDIFIEISDSDGDGSGQDPFKRFEENESKKPALDSVNPSSRKTPKWFRKEFMEMKEQEYTNDASSIDRSISDGYSREDSFGGGSYSSYSTDGSLDYEDPATSLIDAVTTIFSPLNGGAWQSALNGGPWKR